MTILLYVYFYRHFIYLSTVFRQFSQTFNIVIITNNTLCGYTSFWLFVTMIQFSLNFLIAKNIFVDEINCPTCKSKVKLMRNFAKL